MKRLSLIFLLALSFQSVQGREWVSKINKYIHKDTNQIIELGGWDLSEDGTTNKFFNYETRKYETVQMSDYIPATQEEIANVQAGEMIITKTLVAHSKTEVIERICSVFYLFENNKAYVGCKSDEADNLPGYTTPSRFDFIVNDVANVVGEINEFEGFKKGDTAELGVETKAIKNGKTVRILAVMANGEALIQKMGFSILDTSSILFKSGVERVKLIDLIKK